MVGFRFHNGRRVKLRCLYVCVCASPFCTCHVSACDFCSLSKPASQLYSRLDNKPIIFFSSTICPFSTAPPSKYNGIYGDEAVHNSACIVCVVLVLNWMRKCRQNVIFMLFSSERHNRFMFVTLVIRVCCSDNGPKYSLSAKMTCCVLTFNIQRKTHTWKKPKTKITDRFRRTWS